MDITYMFRFEIFDLFKKKDNLNFLKLINLGFLIKFLQR